MVPHDVVHLGTAAFHATVVGLPWQLGELLTLIEEVRPGLKWYVADVQAVGTFPLPRGEKRPTWVGDAKPLPMPSLRSNSSRAASSWVFQAS